MSDWMATEELVREYVAEVKSGTSNCDRLGKYDTYIMEAAVEAVFGSEIWDEINPILEEM